jgi:hypothetical protein
MTDRDEDSISTLENPSLLFGLSQPARNPKNNPNGDTGSSRVMQVGGQKVAVNHQDSGNKCSKKWITLWVVMLGWTVVIAATLAVSMPILLNRRTMKPAVGNHSQAEVEDKQQGRSETTSPEKPLVESPDKAPEATEDEDQDPQETVVADPQDEAEEDSMEDEESFGDESASESVPTANHFDNSANNELENVDDVSETGIEAIIAENIKKLTQDQGN